MTNSQNTVVRLDGSVRYLTVREAARVQTFDDDYVFLRPNQSEALFLQFGDLAVFEGGRIAERWPTFPISA